MHKRFIALQRNIEDQKETIKILLSREEDMREQVNQLKDFILILNDRCNQKGNTRTAKLAILARLGRQQKELSQFKYVLDEKLNEMNNSLAYSGDLDLMKKDINATQNELERFSSENVAIECFVSFTNDSIRKLQSAISMQRKKQSSLAGKHNNLIKWLQDTLDAIQRPDDLSKQIQKLSSNFDKSTHISNSKDCDDEDRTEANDLYKLLHDARAILESTQIKQQEELHLLRRENQQMLDEMTTRREELSKIRLQTKQFQCENNPSSL